MMQQSAFISTSSLMLVCCLCNSNLRLKRSDMREVIRDQRSRRDQKGHLH